MDSRIIAAAVALAVAAAACSQGISDNVMSPEANALDPADINAALGPEVTTTSEENVTANDVDEAANVVDNGAAEEPTDDNSAD